MAISAEDHLMSASTRIRSQNSIKFRQIGATTLIYKHSFSPRSIPEWNGTTDEWINELWMRLRSHSELVCLENGRGVPTGCVQYQKVCKLFGKFPISNYTTVTKGLQTVSILNAAEISVDSECCMLLPPPPRPV